MHTITDTFEFDNVLFGYTCMQLLQLLEKSNANLLVAIVMEVLSLTFRRENSGEPNLLSDEAN